MGSCACMNFVLTGMLSDRHSSSGPLSLIMFSRPLVYLTPLFWTFSQLVVVEELSPKPESSPAPAWIVLDGRITSLVLRVFLLFIHPACCLPFS